MLRILVSITLAGEPVVEGPGVPGGGPAPVPARVELGWDEVGYAAAGVERAAFGPDALALGPDGAWALWDPVLRMVHGSGGSFAVPGATDLAFTDSGDLLVLDTRTRSLSRWSGGRRVATVALPGLCPTSVRLRVLDGAAWGEDVLGNLHPIARVDGTGFAAWNGERLREAAVAVRRVGDGLELDGRRLPLSGVAGARAEGDWLIVDLGAPGHTRRVLYHPESGARVDIEGQAGWRYRPADGVAVGPDGRVGWIEPGAQALVIRTEAP